MLPGDYPARPGRAIARPCPFFSSFQAANGQLNLVPVRLGIPAWQGAC
jgi:hypothetical protein